MAQASRYYRIDQDILLEFIYHDQSDPEKYRIEVDDNGSEVMFLDTVDQDPFSPRHLLNELGSAVVNFDVTSVSGYIAVENFAGRTLLLESGKTYKFDLSALANPADFSITGNLGIYNFSAVTNIGEFTPSTNGKIEYEYPGLIGGKIIIDNRANPLFASPDEATGNDINQTIGRYHAVKAPGNDNTKYALLGYDSTGAYEMHNFINNTSEWLGGNEADLLNYQTEATANINWVLYDSVKLHLRSGFSFDSRGYEGFLFEILSERNTTVKNFLTQLVYLNTSNYEFSNPKPFILGETLWSKFINLKIPSLVNQNAEFNDRFYGDGTIGSSDLNPLSNYQIRFKLIDSLYKSNGKDYFNTGEENIFTVSREDEYADFTLTVEDAADGDYFNIYGEKDNSINAFEAYVLNRIRTSSDDIVVIYDIDVYEQISTSQVKSQSITFTQYESFNDPIVFRPVIKNAGVAVNFSIEATMRIYNQTDNTQIVKRSSLTVNQASKYGKKLSSLKIDNPNILTEVYNVLPNLSSGKVISGFITDNLPRSTKFVPAFVERHNVIASTSKVNLNGSGNNDMIKEVEEFETSDFVESSDLLIEVAPFASYYKFVIGKRKNDDFDLISFENAERIILSFNDGATKLKFNNIYNKDIDTSKGEVLFMINEANASNIRGMKTNSFYISVDNGKDETMVTKGKFTIG
jgi:hypothetical protein